MLEETPEQRHQRYLHAEQWEVSDPDEWATNHHGHLAWDDYNRMLAFSQANQIRLKGAMVSLQARREQAEQSGNWEETAMAEVQSLRDIA